ncbi:hypothetical protein BDW22DRAFT_1354793 [Trametopsis cervina]|nr:hypothetical protein BDW22DRAFT_1354793 [Trametopsis cervina]
MATHVGILPNDVLDTLLSQLEDSDSAQQQRNLRFLRLPHPRTGVPSLFLPYELRDAKQTSILEVQMIAPPNQRSWFLSEGQVLENGNLLMMTPIDPAFLLIPLLQTTIPLNGGTATFRPLDDVIDLAVEKMTLSPPYPPDPKDPTTRISQKDIRTFLSLDCAHSAMKRVCEVKEITSEITVYRYSVEKVISYLKIKVDRLNNPELFETSRTLVRTLAKDGLMEDGKEQLLEAGRLKSACDLVCQYAPTTIRSALLAAYDFASFDLYMKSLQDEAASLAAAEMSKAEAKESKGAKGDKSGDKKRKGPAKGSVGVEKLKKANTRGMAKLSTFFQAKS